jgi:excisionase family DNA binding protein
LPEWLTVAEAAKYLKVHRTTIYDLVDRGVLPYFELKGARGRRFKREDLDALLEPGGQSDGRRNKGST